eukprot:CAMPEP_0198124242 /NCGR_PEP_ID=MMETSP1442-20131203/39505_1 /TAXON_ID= /ORGANISM="Craspedostauros australis, Strain CCMP3328" /LENGTH=143 /DNA_ID=CAMNT_0043783611 /DNA_START=131 /DNA_END=562 /DNA_ORIENTATION=-
MGASASSPSATIGDAANKQQEQEQTETNDEQSTMTTTSTSTSTSTSRGRKQANPKGLTGVRLVEYRCRKSRKAWNGCVSEIYNGKFLSGESMEPEGDCDDLFERYRTCYMRGMLKQRQKQGLPPPKEGTMLHEFMEEEEQDDE